MEGDKDRFLTLRKEIYGSVSFGNDDLAKIIGKGTVRIGNKNTKEKMFYCYHYNNFHMESKFCGLSNITIFIWRG
jgi:hypothetical protein